MSKKLFGGLLAAVFLIVIGAAVFFLTRTDENVELAEDFFKTTYDEAQENVKPEVRTVVLNDGMQKAYRRTLWILFAVFLVGGLAYVSMLTLRILSAFF